MPLLAKKDDFLQKFIEAVILRTPSDIINLQGFDFTIGSPLRAFGEGLCTVAAISQDTIEAEIKKQARETLFLLSGVEPIPASRASGVLSITSTQTTTISVGEPVYSSELGTKVAEVVEEVSFINVETKDVPILADDAGADVSLTALNLFLTASNQSGTNPLIINNGTDKETDYARTLRIEDALKAKAHATAPALITAAGNVVLTDINGSIIESVQNVQMAFPWKVEDPETLDPERLGEIVISIQSSLGVPSTELLDAIQLVLTGNDELDGKQGAGQDVLLQAVETEDIAFTVPYIRLAGYVHATIVAEIQSRIATYVASLNQGESIDPTDWQYAIYGVEGVDYYDEENMVPSTIQTIDQFKIWNITSITVNEVIP